MKDRKRRGDQASVQRAAALDNVVLFEASFTSHVFGRHAHESLSIGVVNSGTGAFWCEGKRCLAPRDSLVLIAPGEVHTGESVGDCALHYRMIYISGDSEPDQCGSHWPFREHAPTDARGAMGLRQLYHVIATSSNQLRATTSLAGFLAWLKHTYTGRKPGAGYGGREQAAVSRVRDYLHAHTTENPPLARLAEIAQLNQNYLVSAFRRVTGLPPHAYLVQLRLNQAISLLKSGVPVAQAACRAGFTDQSHLTRHFRRQTGLTPAAYQKQTRM